MIKIGSKAIGTTDSALNPFLNVKNIVEINNNRIATINMMVIAFAFFSLLISSSLVYSVTNLVSLMVLFFMGYLMGMDFLIRAIVYFSVSSPVPDPVSE